VPGVEGSSFDLLQPNDPVKKAINARDKKNLTDGGLFRIFIFRNFNLNILF
jgi:hypothetical protein